MKTINTTLPVYRTLAHQCYERSKKAHNQKAPTVTPFHRLPSLQWNIEDDNAGYINSVKLKVENPVSILTGWTNGAGGAAFATFQASGTSVTSAINNAVSHANSNDLTVKYGTLYIATVNLTLNTGASLDMKVANGLTLTTGDNYVTMYNGVNIIPIRCTADSTNAYIRLNNTVGAINFSMTISLEEEVMDRYFGERQSYISTYTNGGYDTLTTLYRTSISVIKTTAADVDYFTLDLLSALNVTSGDTFRMVVVLRLNSGTAPKMVIVDSGGNDISNVVTLKDGLNYIVFKATGTDAASVIRVRNGAGESSNFIFIPAIYVYKITPNIENVTDDIFQYEGSTLQHLLPAGGYYLEMTSTEGYYYYSDYFIVSCVYPNLITGWANTGYENFASSGTEITSAVNNAGTGYATGDTFTVFKGEKIKVLFNLRLISGDLPVVYLINSGWTADDSENAVEGLNEIEFISEWDGDAAIIIYNGTNTSYVTSDISVIRNYSEDYITINFQNSCDLGEIDYTVFDQTLWLETEAMEPTFPYTEKGQENGDGEFIPTWQRQDKIYQIRTKLLPLYLIDVLHRLKLHDTVTLIDTVGDEYTVEQIDVEHEWQFDDKYYGLATLSVDLGEGIVNTGCCS